MRLFFCAISIVALSGCSSTLQLKPETGESVVVEFIESSNGIDGEGFINVFHDDYDCYGFSVAGGGRAARQGAAKKIPVPGKRYFTFAPQYLKAHGAFSVSSCMPAYSFPIRAGGRYKVMFGNDGKTCTTSVLMLEGGAEKVVPLMVREYVRPMSDGQGPWCKADPALAGSSSLLLPRGGR